jgi:tetratricopeptide (TPR) repeat protein
LAQTNLPAKILVVDDDAAVGQAIEHGLAKHNITTIKATNLENALYQFNQNRFEVVIIELDFGPLPGLALMQKWRNHEMLDKRSAGFIVLGSGGQRSAGHEGLIKELGDIEIIMKPVNPIQLLPMISRALGTKNKNAKFQEFKSKMLEPLMKSGHVDKAIEKAKQLAPELGDRVNHVVVDLLEKSAKYQECLDLSVNMLSRDNNNIGLINTAGRMCLKLGKMAEAKSLLEKADKLAPTNLDRLNTMAQMYLQVKSPDKAVDVFRQLVKLNPESPEYKFDVFKQLYDAGYDEHAVNFGKEVAQPMEIVRYYNNRGVMLAKEGKQAEAILEYQRAIRFFPKFKENNRIYYNMALAFAGKKTRQDYVEASKYLQKALELDPSFEKAKTTLATIQKSLGGAA